MMATEGSRGIRQRVGLNGPPDISNIELTPDPAYTDSLLEVTADITDVNGDTLTVTYDWTVNTTVVRSSTANELDGTSSTMGFSKGDTVVDIIADDGTDTTTVTVPAIVIANTPRSTHAHHHTWQPHPRQPVV